MQGSGLLFISTEGSNLLLAALQAVKSTYIIS